MRHLVSAIALAAILLLAARDACAQGGQVGLVACENCGAAADLPAAALFGFRVPNPATPDVLFDETRVGGGNLGGVAAPSVGGALWSIPPNWRMFLSAADVAAIVLNEGSVYFDSSGFFDTDMGANTMQVLCSSPGAMAPLVSDAGPDKVIEWTPIAELNTAVIANECTLAGAVVRGFIIGYNVYGLPVTSFPNPTRRDFVVSGYLAHADLSALDFNVPDPDGLSGSDRDPGDGLRLRNPDGLPDTGDEVLVLTLAGAGGDDSWYRVQPVVEGEQSFYDGGLSGSSGVPATRLDLDGDGTRESVDIARDGFLEFIDPSGRGLGLTWAGEIASSLQPGRATPTQVTPGCNGLPPVATETDCGDGTDDDGDTLIDCLDAADCCASVECAAAPPEITRVDVSKPILRSDEIRIAWSPVVPQSPGAVHDVVSGCLCLRVTAPDPRAPGCLWQDRGFTAASCLADDEAGLSLSDTRPIVAQTLGHYYLVREQSACGVAGSYGRDSRARERLMGAAACSP